METNRNPEAILEGPQLKTKERHPTISIQPRFFRGPGLWGGVFVVRSPSSCMANSIDMSVALAETAAPASLLLESQDRARDMVFATDLGDRPSRGGYW